MSDIQVRTATEADRERWDEFVLRHSECTNYHRWSWRYVFQEVFGWPAIYLLAEEDRTVRGILPLISQKCLLRNYLSSMPHLKGGGIVAEDSKIGNVLLEAAIQHAQRRNASYLELRQTAKHALPLVLRHDKIAAVLPIENDSEKRLGQLEKKTRNLVRKSLTFGMTSEVGGPALLTEFYEVYRRNMRDLGSPSYARDFFAEVLRSFPEDTRICVARLENQTVAAGFLLGFRGTLEVAWASSYRKFLHLKPNMFLYWNILTFGAEHGYQCLDFGRSSRNSGTFDFKRQWGAIASDLHWGYWLNRRAAVPNTHQNGLQIANRMWRRLPLAITNLIGPRLVRHIPGV
ncbi:MAG: FemAB family XrtA/PEP-CTERM system-associated protein [Terriglobia bacterium]